MHEPTFYTSTSTLSTYLLSTSSFFVSSFVRTYAQYYSSLILTTLRTQNVSFAFIGSVWFQMVCCCCCYCCCCCSIDSRLTQIAFGNHSTNSLKIKMEKSRRRRTRLYKKKYMLICILLLETNNIDDDPATWICTYLGVCLYEMNCWWKNIADDDNDNTIPVSEISLIIFEKLFYIFQPSSSSLLRTSDSYFENKYILLRITRMYLCSLALSIRTIEREL